MAESLPKGRARHRIAILMVRGGITLTLSFGAVITSSAQVPPSRDLTQFTLEDLMNAQVISVSKKEQKLAKAGAAIFVITQEDIRRSGATNIPDLLRMVPGVDVARVDHSSWAISIRGFNSVYANKVLVLIDGRSVYHPAYSGVLWYAQDLPLEDIARIEVIRGPGGTVWGANAMNGVINIITKRAQDTPGGLIAAGAGSGAQAEGLIQYGGKIGQTGNYRVYGRYSNLGTSDAATSAQPADSKRLKEGGFRSDWRPSPQDLLTVQGEARMVDGGETITGVISGVPPIVGTFDQPTGDDDGDILARWTHTYLNGSDISLQAYFDQSHVFANGANDWASIGDLDFAHHLNAGSRHDVVWGLNYRVDANRFGRSNLIALNPVQRTDSLYGAFVQDEITISKTLSLTLGSKFEHNAYTGFEIEPSAQLVWAPSTRHTLWTSAARAIRQPSSVDSGLQAVSSIVALPQGAVGVVTVSGNPNTKVEQLRDFEIGYRAQIHPRLSLDVTGFLSFYRNLQTTEPLAPYFMSSGAFPHAVIPFIYEYNAHALSYGAETFATWNVTDRWKISPGLSMLNLSASRDPSSQDSTVDLLAGHSPRRSYQVRSFINLGRSFEWDQTIGYTGPLATGNIPGYVRLDLRLGWRFGEFCNFSIAGQNLLQPRHAEFPDIDFINHMQDQRSVFGKITWRF
jgi:iron complex outermembrane recepter protein